MVLQVHINLDIKSLSAILKINAGLNIFSRKVYYIIINYNTSHIGTNAFEHFLYYFLELTLFIKYSPLIPLFLSDGSFMTVVTFIFIFPLQKSKNL